MLAKTKSVAVLTEKHASPIRPIALLFYSLKLKHSLVLASSCQRLRRPLLNVSVPATVVHVMLAPRAPPSVAHVEQHRFKRWEKKLEMIIPFSNSSRPSIFYACCTGRIVRIVNCRYRHVRFTQGRFLAFFRIAGATVRCTVQVEIWRGNFDAVVCYGTLKTVNFTNFEVGVYSLVIADSGFVGNFMLLLLATVNSRSRSLYDVVRPSVVCL